VSLEFDHATSDELPAIRLANGDGIPVTLFVLSGRVGAPGYLSAAQLDALQADGDEIGGHTVDHLDLSQLSPAAQQHEICDDRTALQADGLHVTDFAYPYGHLTAATPAIVAGCGYESARGTGGLASQGGCYGLCPAAESIPPANPYLTRTVNSIVRTTTLSTIEGYVLAAQRVGGGWLQIVFHHICNGCDQYSTTQQTFASLVAWLAARRLDGVAMRTVRQVIEAPFDPGELAAAVANRRQVRVAPFQRCPSTPVTARCTVAGHLRAPVLRLGSQRRLELATETPVGRLSVLELETGRTASRHVRGGPLRWSVILRRPQVRAAVVVTAVYALGTASYRLVVTR
jgi:hypothetical protein